MIQPYVGGLTELIWPERGSQYTRFRSSDRLTALNVSAAVGSSGDDCDSTNRRKAFDGSALSNLGE